ncbi:hypothetical protein HMPREF0291_10378 [Corynebacterium genitalium ATCC 33030]|uniref:Copper chaperone PCu(A)C n=2 Tax=Corynebacterium genitalium TaxID=38288 RepID=D7WB89_9CORY|nr:hypothetical protein HMPREF0291_10378 [Corynebacterium genitalium ATCC 33030]
MFNGKDSIMKKPLTLAAVLCAGALGLAGCGDNTETAGTSETTSEATPDAASGAPSDVASEASSEATIELVDGYCRAKPAADDDAAMESATDLDKKHSDMTACFGTLKNTSDQDISVKSFAVPSLEGASTELHEVVDGVMQEKPGGFTVAPGETYELVPGGDHLMIMNYDEAIPAGETLEVEITTDADTTLSIEIPVREQPSGEENYGGHEGHDDHE